MLFWVYGFPLFLAIGLGIAFSGRQQNAGAVAIQEAPGIDTQKAQEKSEMSRLQQALEEGGLAVQVQSPEVCRQLLRTGKIDLTIEVTPEGYRYVYDPNGPDSPRVRYQVDGLIQRWKAGPSAWKPLPDVFVHEPGNRYIDFLIPGLMGLNLMGGGLWGVGFVIVDMRTCKLLKRLLATPMRRSDFLLSILVSRVVFLVPEMLLLALAGLRRKEAMALEWEETEEAPWVDLDRERIWLPGGFVKGAEDQWIALDPELRKALEGLPRHGARCFASKANGDRSARPGFPTVSRAWPVARGSSCR